MYAKITGDTVNKYPYSIDDLRKDNPTVSFPVDSLSRADIQTDYKVEPVVAVSQPVVSGHNSVEMSGQSFDQCREHCHNDSGCRSFDWKPISGDDKNLPVNFALSISSHGIGLSPWIFLSVS